MKVLYIFVGLLCVPSLAMEKKISQTQVSWELMTNASHDVLGHSGITENKWNALNVQVPVVDHFVIIPEGTPSSKLLTVLYDQLSSGCVSDSTKLMYKKQCTSKDMLVSKNSLKSMVMSTLDNKECTIQDLLGGPEEAQTMLPGLYEGDGEPKEQAWDLKVYDPNRLFLIRYLPYGLFEVVEPVQVVLIK